MIPYPQRKGLASIFTILDIGGHFIINNAPSLKFAENQIIIRLMEAERTQRQADRYFTSNCLFWEKELRRITMEELKTNHQDILAYAQKFGILEVN